MFQSLDMHKRRRPDDLMPVRPDDPSDRTTLATRGAGLTGAHAADGGGDATVCGPLATRRREETERGRREVFWRPHVLLFWLRKVHYMDMSHEVI